MDAQISKPVGIGQVVVTSHAAFLIENMVPEGIIVACYRAAAGGMQMTRRIVLEPSIRTMRELADHAAETLLKLA